MLTCPLQEKASSIQKNLIMLFAAGVISLRKEVNPYSCVLGYLLSILQLRPPVPAPEIFLDRLWTWSLECADNDLQRRSVWHMIASIVNKQAEGQDRKSTITDADVDSLLSHRRDKILGQQAGPFLDGERN